MMQQDKSVRMISLTLCLAMVLLCSLSLIGTLALAQSTSKYFPETGHTVTGRFLNYWQSNGGLMQQGYPISEEMQEISEIDGKTYTIQYFERAVFEYHSDKAAPYDVLLSLLGRIRYKQKYPNGTPNQKPNESDGSVLFDETGKRLGGSFLTYWRQFGGISQQGYPISDEIQERSDLDGNVYTIQYFERSVMEWHPGNTPPYDVLLSQLGKFRYDEKYGGANHTPGDPQLVAYAVESKPIGAGHFVIYLRDDKPSPDPYNHYATLFGYNLEQNVEFLISGTPSNKGNLATDGTYVAWTEFAGIPGVERPQSLFVYDLRAGSTREVLTATLLADAYFSDVALDRGVLYYRDATPDHMGLFARTLATGNEILISERGVMPAAGAGAVVWEEHQGNPNEGWSLHLSKLDGSITNRVITETGKFFSGYDVSGDAVVWGFGAQLYHLDVYLYNLTDNTSSLIGREGIDPHINGNKVVWIAGNVRIARSTGISTSVMLYDLKTHATSMAVDASDDRPLYADIIDGDILLYTLMSNSGRARDLYIRDLGSIPKDRRSR